MPVGRRGGGVEMHMRKLPAPRYQLTRSSCTFHPPPPCDGRQLRHEATEFIKPRAPDLEPQQLKKQRSGVCRCFLRLKVHHPTTETQVLLQPLNRRSRRVTKPADLHDRATERGMTSGSLPTCSCGGCKLFTSPSAPNIGLFLLLVLHQKPKTCSPCSPIVSRRGKNKGRQSPDKAKRATLMPSR